MTSDQSEIYDDSSDYYTSSTQNITCLYTIIFKPIGDRYDQLIDLDFKDQTFVNDMIGVINKKFQINITLDYQYIFNRSPKVQGIWYKILDAQVKKIQPDKIIGLSDRLKKLQN